MKITDRISAVASMVLHPAIHVGVSALTDIYEFVINCEYAWRHPNGCEVYHDLRMYQEWCISDAKADGKDYVMIDERWYRKLFYTSLLELGSHMKRNGATDYEYYTIEQIANGFVWPSRRDRISINNLRWIQKMEDKYRTN